MVRQPERCPICERPADPRYRPFCTARCQEVDLGRWLSGGYVIPGPPAELEEDPVPSSDKE